MFTWSAPECRQLKKEILRKIDDVEIRASPLEVGIVPKCEDPTR